MKIVSNLLRALRGNRASDALTRLQGANAAVYELVDQLPLGPARLAAWNAFARQTYADKLIAACRSEVLPDDTARIVAELCSTAGLWLGKSAGPAAITPGALESLPRWHTAVRSTEQLVGMRNALDALRAHAASHLEALQAELSTIESLRGRLAAIDKHRETVDILWIRNPPDEIRGGIGDALVDGLDETYALGQALMVGS